MRTTIPTAAELAALTEPIEYFNVNGVPVAVIDDVEVYRYDGAKPEWFALQSVLNDGVEITVDEFKALLPSAP